eukprot:760782-Hanusia_phi.AAC.1
MFTRHGKEDFVHVFEGLSISSSLDYLPSRLDTLNPHKVTTSAPAQQASTNGRGQGQEASRQVSLVGELEEENRRLAQALREMQSEVKSLHELLWNSQVAPSQEELTTLLLGSLADSLSMQTDQGEEEAMAEVQQENQKLRLLLSEHGVIPPASPRKRIESGSPADLKRQLVQCTKIIKEQQKLLQQQQQQQQQQQDAAKSDSNMSE